MTSSLLVTCAIAVIKHNLDYKKADAIPLELVEKVDSIQASLNFWDTVTDASNYKQVRIDESDYIGDFLHWQTDHKEANYCLLFLAASIENFSYNRGFLHWQTDHMKANYCHLFLAASIGDLKLFKLLTSERNLTLDKSILIENMLLIAINNGHLDIIKYLCEELDFQPTKKMMISMIDLTCPSDRLNIIRYLCEKQNFQPDKRHLDILLLFGSMDLVRYFYEERPPDALRVLPSVYFMIKACEQRRLDIVQYLCEKLHIQPNIEVLVNACYYGCTDIVQYLCEKVLPVKWRIQPTSDPKEGLIERTTNLLNLSKPIFEIAVIRGHLDIVYYLCEKVLPVEWRIQPVNSALSYACYNDKPNVARYLCNELNPAALRVKPTAEHLDLACIGGLNTANIVRCLCKELGVTTTPRHLELACIDDYDNVEIVRCLCKEFGVTPTDKHLNIACNGRHDQMKIVRCLCKELGVTPTKETLRRLIERNNLASITFLCDELEPAERRIQPTRDMLYHIPNTREYLHMFNYLLAKVKASEASELCPCDIL